MSSIKWEFPHPLLAAGRDDYSVGSFSIVEGNHRSTAEDFIFSFSYDLNCPGLEKYIEDVLASRMTFPLPSTIRTPGTTGE